MKAVGLDQPLFVRRGEGAYLETVEGERLVDWVMSFGPLILGHADPETVEAVRAAAGDGTAPPERRHRVSSVGVMEPLDFRRIGASGSQGEAGISD